MTNLYKNLSFALNQEFKLQKLKREIYVGNIINNFDLLNIGGIRNISLNEKEIFLLQEKNITIIRNRVDFIIKQPFYLTDDIVTRNADDLMLLADNISQQHYDASCFETALYFQRLPDSYISFVASFDDALKGMGSSKEKILEVLETESNKNLSDIKIRSKKIMKGE